MIREARDERMRVVQVEVQALAEPADRAGDVEHVSHGAAHRVLDVGGQLGQPGVAGAEVPEVQAGMAAGEPGGRQPVAEVADIDAAATRSTSWSFSATSTNQAGSRWAAYSRKTKGAVRPLAQARVELAQHGQQAVGLVPHVALVVDDQAADAAREAVGELPDRGAALLVQQVEAAVQVDYRQVWVRGHEIQDVLKLAGRVGVRLGGQARLSEAEASKLEQRIVPGEAPLEQGMEGLRHLLVRAGCWLVLGSPGPSPSGRAYSIFDTPRCGSCSTILAQALPPRSSAL